MEKIIKYIACSFIIIFSLFILNIFEIDFGRCLNDAGDGKLYNGEPYYNYISYRGIGQQDDIIMTFCINNFYGDCEWRGDIVILRNTKEG